jgi:Fe-S-cluster containining protein
VERDNLYIRPQRTCFLFLIVDPMKTLTGKVRAVERVYLRLDREIAKLQSESGLTCLSGCGECCKKADIEATPVEFLPLALKLYDEGKALSFYEELQSKSDSLCHVFRPFVTNFGGMCSEYPQRGLICRLFGYSARINKEGAKELVTCKLLKEQRTLHYEKAVSNIKAGKNVPVMSAYYTRMASIDPSLSQFFPINQAMAKALEVVLHYYAYRRRRSNKTDV